MNEHLLIAGGGQAATQAAQSARQAGYGGRISMICAEPSLPYQRPPLSKSYLAGQLDAERLLLKPEQFFETREIDVFLGTRVESLDPARSSALLDNGDAVGFTDLVLATGSSPVRLAVPGAELEGIHCLRTISDVEAIMKTFESIQKLVLVGAGYIGLEVAAVASKAGIEVTVLEAQERCMSRTACASVSEFFERRHRDEGVAFEFNAKVAAFHGGEAVNRVETEDGRHFDCQMVIVAIGIRPCIDLAERAGLAIENGIAVDTFGQTSAPHILAAGDCTSHPHPAAGQRIRLESVQNAIEQGKAVASVVCKEPKAFDAVPWFWSDQYDLKLQIAGLSAGYDTTVVRGDPDSGSFSVFYLKAGQVIAVDAVNDARSFITAKNLLMSKPRWPESAIADPDCDLAAL